MAKPGKTGVVRVANAFGYALQGLKSCWRHEAAFRQEVLALVVFVPAAFYVGESAVEIALLLATCVVVLIVEILNSALEAVVDRIGHEHHELSGRAKDLGAAAVLLSLVMAGLTWGLVLFL
jgi:diacylglycerol kinase (ATP)